MGRLQGAASLAAILVVVSLPTLRTLASPAICVAGPSDVLAQNIPMEEWFHDALRKEGALPLWRASQFYGQGTLEDPQQRILYPPYYIVAVLDEPLAHHVFMLFHFLALAAGMYLLARGERCSRLAAAFAALALTLSFKSFAYLQVGWDNIFCAVAWVPFVLAGFREALRTGGRRGIPTLAVSLALTCFAGTPMMFAYLGLSLPVVALADRRRRPGRLALVLALGFGLGFALAAPGLLPSIRAAGASARATLETSYGTSIESDIPGTLAMPSFTHETWDFANALGFAALPLAFAGVMRGRRARFWAWLALLCIVFAAGDATPVGKLVAKLPLVGTLSYLSRLLWIVAIGQALLAAQGLDALLRLRSWRSRRGRRLLTGLGAGFALLVVAAAWPHRLEKITPEGVSTGMAGLGLALELVLALGTVTIIIVRPDVRRKLLALVVVLCAAELLLLSELLLVRIPWSQVTGTGRIEEALAKEPLARVASVTTRSLWLDPVLPFYAARGVERADGYNPLHTLAVRRYLYSIAPDKISRHAQGFGHMGALWQPYAGIQAVERPGFLELGVTHVLAHEPLPGFQVVATETRLVESPGGEWIEKPVTLMRVDGALPRAFLAIRAQNEPADTQRSVMRRGAFSGAHALYVDGDVPKAHEGMYEAVLPVEVVAYGANRVDLHVRAPKSGGWVVLLDAWSPDWSARVDGEPSPVLVADALFRAVRVEAGEHTIVFRIGFPLAFWVGCGLLVVGLGLSFWIRRRIFARRPRAAPAAPAP